MRSTSSQVPNHNLRRSASRTAQLGKQPPTRLIEAASAGLLTRANTKPGTKGRQAVDRATYLSRLRQRPKGATAREATGHIPSTARATAQISALIDRPSPWVIFEGPSKGERRRAGRYDAYLGQLAEGTISPTRFRRKIESWRPIRGERFLSDPNRALASLEQRRAGDEELFVYESGRSQ